MSHIKYWPNGAGPLGFSVRTSNAMLNRNFDWRNKSKAEQKKIIQDFWVYINLPAPSKSGKGKSPNWKKFANFGVKSFSELQSFLIDQNRGADK